MLLVFQGTPPAAASEQFSDFHLPTCHRATFMQAVYADANMWIISINPLFNMGITSNPHLMLLKLKISASLKLLPYPAAPSSPRPKILDHSHFKLDYVRASAKSQLCKLHATYLRSLPECRSQLFQAHTAPLFTLISTMLHHLARQCWGNASSSHSMRKCCKAYRDTHEMKRLVKVADVI